MSAPRRRNFSRESWRLKLRRAKHHLKEFERQVRAYQRRHPYRVRRECEPDGKGHVRFMLRIEEPDREMQIVMGDIVHNLRSALDHLVVAISPKDRRWEASFPIADANPWRRNRAGNFVDDEGRKRFEESVRDMEPPARALIEVLQPYTDLTAHPAMLDALHLYPMGQGHLGVPETHLLKILARLDNADKHRNLIPIATGLWKAKVRCTYNKRPFKPRTFVLLRNGTTLYDFGTRLPPKGGHIVKVEVRGTVQVAVHVGRPKGTVDAVMLFRQLTERFAAVFLESLEDFLPQ